MHVCIYIVPSPSNMYVSQVIARPGSAYVRWPQRAFWELQRDTESDFGLTVQLMISRTLSEKLKEVLYVDICIYIYMYVSICIYSFICIDR